jgi:hypothetical protein
MLAIRLDKAHQLEVGREITFQDGNKKRHFGLIAASVIRGCDHVYLVEFEDTSIRYLSVYKDKWWFGHAE